MVQAIQAIIGNPDTLRKLARSFRTARVMFLSDDFSMIPITDSLYDEIHEYETSQFEPGFLFLSDRVAALCANASKDAPIAFVETEAFGGCGRQSAAAWQGGSYIFGPASYNNYEGTPEPSASSTLPIGQALAAIGLASDSPAAPVDLFNIAARRVADEFPDDLLEAP